MSVDFKSKLTELQGLKRQFHDHQRSMLTESEGIVKAFAEKVRTELPGSDGIEILNSRKADECGIFGIVVSGGGEFAGVNIDDLADPAIFEDAERRTLTDKGRSKFCKEEVFNVYDAVEILFDQRGESSW